MGRKMIIPIIATFVCVSILFSFTHDEKKANLKETTDYTFPPRYLLYAHESKYVNQIEPSYYLSENFSFLDYFGDKIIGAPEIQEDIWSKASIFDTEIGYLRLIEFEYPSYIISYNPRFIVSEDPDYLMNFTVEIFNSIISNFTSNEMEEFEVVSYSRLQTFSNHIYIYQAYKNHRITNSGISFSTHFRFGSSYWSGLSIGPIYLISKNLPDEININYSENDIHLFLEFVKDEYIQYNTTLFNLNVGSRYSDFSVINGHICNQITIYSNIFNKWRDVVTITLYIDIFSKEPILISRY